MIESFNLADLHARSGLTKTIQDRVSEVLARGVYLQGAEVSSFESAFAEHSRLPHCIAVASGTDALKIALLAAGVEPGDEVLVPALTFVATWLAVSSIGAIPVQVGSDEYHSGNTIGSYLMGPNSCAVAITSRTKAIVPVHLYGHAAEMRSLSAVADGHGITVIEDCAQAHGLQTSDVDRPGVVRAYSFYPTKNLGAVGDAGAIVTNDEQICKRVTMLRNYGGVSRDRIEMAGTNSRMSEIDAAVLNIKLRHLDAWNMRRQQLADRYVHALSECVNLSFPKTDADAQPVWHHFVVQSGQKQKLRRTLNAHGVGTGDHYPRAPGAMPLYQGAWGSHKTTISAQMLLDRSLTLPIGPYLTNLEQDFIVNSLIQSAKELS